MAAQRFARSAAAKTVMFNPESGSELSERGKELQAEMKQRGVEQIEKILPTYDAATGGRALASLTAAFAELRSMAES